MLTLGWVNFLDAERAAIGLPIMLMSTFAYLLLWVEPLRRLP